MGATTETARAGLRPATRGLLVVFSVLTLLAVVVLAGRPDATDRYFAWTIKPPLTAAFLGAGYAAGCVLVALSLRAGRWAAVRMPLLTILAFTALTLLATLLHLGKFHLSGGAPVGVGAAWFWLVVYVVVPPGMLVVWLLQERASTATYGAGVPRALGLALAAEGLLMLVVGAVLYVAPSSAGTIWPWALTPLTARAIASWLIAFGLATVWTAARGRLADTGVQALAYAVFGAAELLVLARFAGEPDWDSAPAWIYLGVAVAVTVTGVAGVLAARAR